MRFFMTILKKDNTLNAILGIVAQCPYSYLSDLVKVKKGR